MNMNEKDYIDSTLEIKATDNFKHKTVLHMKQAANIVEDEKFIAKRRQKISVKKLILACSIGSIFLISTLVYAGVIDLDKIYRMVFGDDYEYVEPEIQLVTGTDNEQAPTSEYDGMVLKVVSAINGEDALRIFATVTDTTGNRLNEDIKFDNWGLSQGNGGNITVVDYNEGTKTATLLITSLGGDHAGSASLWINGFTKGRKIIEAKNENNLNLYDLLKTHKPDIVDKEEVYLRGGASQSKEDENFVKNLRFLKIDELNIQFDNIDWTSISNIGFVNGCLHIQSKILCNNEQSKILSQNHLFSVNFVNDKDEVVYDCHLYQAYVDNEEYMYGAYEGDYFEYHEMIYRDVTNLEQLKDLKITIDYLEEGTENDGEWEVDFDIPERATIDINIFRDMNINNENVRVNKISLSSLGITLNLDKNIVSDYEHDDVVYITNEDGGIVQLDTVSAHGYNDKCTITFTGELIQTDKVKSIVINGKCFDVDSLVVNDTLN